MDNEISGRGESEIMIEDIEIYWLKLPLVDTYHIAGHSISKIDSFLVVLTNSNGIEGIGTSEPSRGHPIPQSPEEVFSDLQNKIVPRVLEKDVKNPNELQKLFEEIRGCENAASAFEVAFYDLYCKLNDISLYDYLGGRLVKKVPLNAWIGLGSPSEMGESAKEWCDLGYKSMKIKIGGESSVDLHRVKSVLDAVSDDVQIRIDANESYNDYVEFIEFANSLNSDKIQHIEQPVPRSNMNDMKLITRETSIDIIADEPITNDEDVYNYLKEELSNGVKLKILKSGGVSRVVRGLNTARAANSSCVFGHGFCAGPSGSTELHISAAIDNVLLPSESVGMLKIEEEPFHPKLQPENGCVSVPDGAGHGIRLDRSTLDGYIHRSMDDIY